MRELYPALEAFASDHLPEQDGHRVYYEQAGSPDGIPVLFLHGGPGSGCNEGHRCYFDPVRYRVILFDQRGCHRSVPNGLLTHNETDALLTDMERIRCQSGVDRWLLFGGSWGATLALLYAEAYPERVLGLILRGTFLARRQDLDWFVNGVRHIFPEHWKAFCDRFPDDQRAEKFSVLYAWLTGTDTGLQEFAARIWSQWAGTVVTASLGTEYQLDTSDMELLVNHVRIEMHYAVNRYFMEEDQILQQIGRLPAVPVYILHGRRDLTCLPSASWELHCGIPGSRLRFLSTCGHLASEPAMIDALIQATDSMAERLA